MLSTVTASKNSSIDTIAIGGFDGMHIAHQRLFSRLGECGAIVVVETGYANLTPSCEREHYSHHPITYFNLEKIRHLGGGEFLELLHTTFPKLKKIVVGYDFHFGRNRKHDIASLRSLFSGEVEVVEEVMLNNESVHSHKVRQFLSEADIEKANRFLGHNHSIRGQHIQGQGLGKKELVATINLTCKGYLLPKDGVYASFTQVDDEEHFHPSVSFIGHRESTDGNFAVETHILDGEVTCNVGAKISFISYIRPNQKFESLTLLKEQISKDIEFAEKKHSIIGL